MIDVQPFNLNGDINTWKVDQKVGMMLGSDLSPSPQYPKFLCDSH